MESGVATRPIEDLEAYARAARPLRVPLRLHHEAAVRAGEGRRRSASSTPRARTSACCAPCRSIVEEGIARPILIGRPSVVEARLKRFGLSIRPGRDFELVNPEDDPRYRDYVATYCRGRRPQGHHARCGRARWCAPTPTVIGALAVRRGDADAMICGLEGRFQSHLRHIRDIIGLAPGAQRVRGAVASSSPRRAPISSPTPMCSPIRPRRRSPTWRSPAPSHVRALRHRAQDRAAVATRISAPPTRRSARKMREALALIARAGAGPRGRRRDAGRHGAVRR